MRTQFEFLFRTLWNRKDERGKSITDVRASPTLHF